MSHTVNPPKTISKITPPTIPINQSTKGKIICIMSFLFSLEQNKTNQNQNKMTFIIKKNDKAAKVNNLKTTFARLKPSSRDFLY